MPWPKVCVVGDCSEVCCNLREFLTHLRGQHQFGPRILITCPCEDCPSIATSIDSFRKHVEKRHRVECGIYQRSSDCERYNGESRGDVAAAEDEVEVGSAVDVLEERNPSAEEFDRIMSSLPTRGARLKLQIEHQYNLPHSVASGIFREAVHFALELQQGLKSPALQRLNEIGIQDDLLHLFLSSREAERICAAIPDNDLSSLKDLGYVEPRQYDLLELAEELGQNHNFVQQAQRPLLHYVPILETIQSYLSHPDVLQSVLREAGDSEHYSSFRDGSLFKEHPIFQREPNALRLTLYTDELELCNPLGGSNVKHKLCCVYFQISNVGARHLSSLTSIHLAVLVKDSYKTAFGYGIVLQPLFADLAVLAERGVHVTMRAGGVFHFYGAVATFLGDNLSSHHLGGFSRCFSSGKVCRWCLADYDQLRTLSSESECCLRTEYNIQRHAELVSIDKSLESLYGIVGKSVLVNVPFFRLPYCLPPDIMHDLFEKILLLNVKVVVKGLAKDKVVSLKDSAALISAFKYGILDRVNKHRAVTTKLLSSKKPLRGSASQKWHLFYFLSIIIGPHVPEGNWHWRLHLLLVKICDIVLAPVISAAMVQELRELVTKHHKLWVRLVPHSYPPKLHYIMHYATFICMVGPLRHQWCMRFEAFHQFIKRMSQKCNNFINITKTLAERVQKKRCLDYSGCDALPSDIKLTSQQTTTSFDCLCGQVQAALLQVLACRPSAPIISVNSVTVSGLNVRKQCYYITDVSDDGLPVFLCVKDIYIVFGEPVVVGHQMATKTFNAHLNAYEVENVQQQAPCGISAAKLQFGQALHVYTVQRKQFIKLKFKVI